MSAIIPAGFANASWIFSSNFGTGPFVFTIGFDLTGGIEDPVDFANALKSAFTSSFNSDLSEGLTLDKVTLAIGQGGDITDSIDSDTNGITGTRTGANDPIALALLVNKKSATPGRRGRGRFFIPGVLAGDDTGLGGDLTPSAKTKHEANLTDFGTAVQSAVETHPSAGGPVILHSVVGVTPSPITSLTLAPKIGVLRKRLR